MHFSIELLIAGLGIAAVLQIVSYVLTASRRAARAKELGCEPPPVAREDGFIGLKLLREVQQADKEWTVPTFWLQRYTDLTKAFGRPATTWQYNLLGATTFTTVDPKNIQAMLATQFEDFGLGTVRRGNMLPLLGDGIFVQDGKPWEHSRSMLRPNFVRDQVADLNLEEKHVQHLMKALPVRENGWTGEVNLQTLFFRLTLDSATEFLFGESINSQITALSEDSTTQSTNPTNTPTADDFAAAFDNGQRHLAKRFRLGNMYKLHNPKDFRDSSKIANSFVDHYVQLALKSSSKEKIAEEGSKARYIFADSLALQTRDPDEIRSQLLNILLAGRDTTASLLSYLFHHLVRNPEVWARLRSAVLKDFGTYSNPDNLSFASLKGCTYLQHCINETLRLTTVVPGNARQALRDTSLPRGGGADGSKPFFVKKGQSVEYIIHVMHQRPDIWGADAAEWKPSRWEGKRPGWEFLPFNGGPRICIGQQFAIVEASYVIVRLLQRFDGMEAAGDELTRKVTANLTLTAAPGVGPTVSLRAAKE